MFTRRVFMVIGMILCLSSTSFAQKGSISGGLVGDPSVVYLADIIKIGDQVSLGGTAKDIFRITVANNTDSDPLTFALEFYKDGELIAHGESSPTYRKTFTLTNNNIKQSPYRLNGFSFDEDKIKSITGTAFSASGPGDLNIPTVLPSGIYMFKLWLKDGMTPTSNIHTIVLTITNPTGYVSLQGPGNPVAFGEPQVLNSPFPTFQWQGDAQEYIIEVFERVEGSQQSFTEVFGNNPHFFKEKVLGQSIQFTGTGTHSRPLVSGHTYFWRVTSVVEVGGRANANQTWSEPFFFTYVDPGKERDGEETGASEAQMMLMIKDMLSALGIDPVWLRNKETQFVSFGGKVFFDGEKIPNRYENNRNLNDLAEALRQLLKNKGVMD